MTIVSILQTESDKANMNEKPPNKVKWDKSVLETYERRKAEESPEPKTHFVRWYPIPLRTLIWGGDKTIDLTVIDEGPGECSLNEHELETKSNRHH